MSRDSSELSGQGPNLSLNFSKVKNLVFGNVNLMHLQLQQFFALDQYTMNRHK